MATISSQGIGSGLDVNSIITQLVALERQPIVQLQGRKEGLQVQLSSYGRVQSLMDTLRSTARTLTDTSTWRAVSASSGDTSSVTATVSAGTPPGGYTVQVNALAASQMTASSALASASTVVGTGTLRIEVGAWNSGFTSFAAKSGTTAVDITIGAEDNTLEGIRDRINDTANLGVRASIVNDASGARLVLRSSITGLENGFRISVTDDDTDDEDNSGLSRLSYNPPAGAVMSRTQSAANAEAAINGLAVSSASNEMTDVVDGLSLKLLKTTASAVEVGVTRDTAAMKKSIESFVDAYNAVAKLLRDQTKYDEGSKNAGALQGDRGAIGLQRQLRSVLGAGSSASSAFERAFQIGMDVQTDGSIKLKGSTLDAALGNIDQINAFFSATGPTEAADGLGVRLRRLADTVLGADGTLTTQQAGLRQRITRADERMERLEDRVAQVEKRLRAQYTALDRTMAGLNGLQGFVTQQVGAWNRRT
ncbi:MAG: flagellar filament capping protein FliD [Aquabacterium sp.]